MNTIKTIFLITIFLLNSCQKFNNGNNTTSTKHISANVKIPEIYYGQFSAEVATEETTTGTASISYNFSITKKGVILSTNTYHEPIRCNGRYDVKLKNHILELFYDDTEQNCKGDDANFRIKKVGPKLFIQGLGGEGTFNEWIEMKKTK